MNIEQRLHNWWQALDEEQRSEARAVRDDLPAWMIASLDQVGIMVVDADLRGHSHVHLMPTRLREFLDANASH